MHITKTNLINNPNENNQQQFSINEQEKEFSRAQKTRIARHQKLIQMVKQYTRTAQEQQKLQRMKRNTVMEIDLRFRNSLENQVYVFPVKDYKQNNSDQELLQQQANIKKMTRYTTYDLHSQNQLTKQPSQSQFLEISRRIKSLDQVRTNSQKVLKKIGRLQTDLINTQKTNQQLSITKLRRANTLKPNPFHPHIHLPEKLRLNTERLKQSVLSPIKYKSTNAENKKQKFATKQKNQFNQVFLPTLSIVSGIGNGINSKNSHSKKKIQNLKTDFQSDAKNKIQNFIAKKLITESYAPYSPIKSKGFSSHKIQNNYFKKK